MSPEEILASESQERMCAIVEPDRVDAFLAVCAKWEVLATVIGEVTDTGRLQVDWHGERIVDVPPRTVAHEGPVYRRSIQRPAEQDAFVDHDGHNLPRPRTRDQLRATVRQLAVSPGLADKSWITDQYDRYVLGNTVLAQPDNAGMIRLADGTTRGVAISIDGSGRYTRLDPYAGAQLALAEAYRNVAATGARPLAVTNCLNFGSPEDPGVMWQFSEAVRGLADGCRELGVPVTGGNVSFYNQTGATRDPAHSDRRRARGDRGRQLPHTARVLVGWLAGLLVGGDARGVRRVRVDACSARLPRWTTAARRPGAGATPGRRPDRRWPGRPARFGARSVPGRPGPGVSWSPASGTASGPASCCPRAWTLRRAVLRIGRAGDRHGAAHRGDALHRPVPGSRPAAPVHRRRRRVQYRASRSRTSSGSRCPSYAGPGRRPCPACSASRVHELVVSTRGAGCGDPCAGRADRRLVGGAARSPTSTGRRCCRGGTCGRSPATSRSYSPGCPTGSRPGRRRPATSVGEFVTRYRRDVAMIEESTRQHVEGRTPHGTDRLGPEVRRPPTGNGRRGASDDLADPSRAVAGRRLAQHPAGRAGGARR